jgi:biotin carboxylase
MKQFYKKAGVHAARYQLLTTLDSAIQFAKEVKYPLFVKPDIGVGSQISYQLRNEDQLKDFFLRKPSQDFILEEFIEGEIFSFDGMTNDQSEVVFFTGHQFPNNIASIVNEDAETYYLTLKTLPDALIKAGKASVKAFGIRQRFFHFEFFRLTKDYPHLGKEGTFIALEANLRPPGGYTMEMINYANSVNAYHIYTDVIATNQWVSNSIKPTFFCAKAARKNHHQYRHDFHAIRQKFGTHLVFENAYPHPISIALGDYFFLAKFQTKEEVDNFYQFVYAK